MSKKPEDANLTSFSPEVCIVRNNKIIIIKLSSNSENRFFKTEDRYRLRSNSDHQNNSKYGTRIFFPTIIKKTIQGTTLEGQQDFPSNIAEIPPTYLAHAAGKEQRHQHGWHRREPPRHSPPSRHPPPSQSAASPACLPNSRQQYIFNIHFICFPINNQCCGADAGLSQPFFRESGARI